MSKFITGGHHDRVSIALCEELGIDPLTTNRIVIDLKAGSPAMIYLATFAEDTTLDVLLQPELRLIANPEDA